MFQSILTSGAVERIAVTALRKHCLPGLGVAHVPVHPLAVELPAESDVGVAAAERRQRPAELGPVLVVVAARAARLVTVRREQRLAHRELAGPVVPRERADRPVRLGDVVPIAAVSEHDRHAHRPAGELRPGVHLVRVVAVRPRHPSDVVLRDVVWQVGLVGARGRRGSNGHGPRYCRQHPPDTTPSTCCPRAARPHVSTPSKPLANLVFEPVNGAGRSQVPKRVVLSASWPGRHRTAATSISLGREGDSRRLERRLPPYTSVT